MEDPDHRLVALTSFPGRDPGDSNPFLMEKYSSIDIEGLEYLVSHLPRPTNRIPLPGTAPTILP
jgi:hypothetical protein